MAQSTRPYDIGRTSGDTNRANQMRRDNDVVKIPKITLYDVDYAIYHHLSNSMNLHVDEDGSSIPVPILFANGEKWAQIRVQGFMRDQNQKVLAPAITIRRVSVNHDERLPTIDVNNYNPQYRLMPMRTMNMRNDRTAGQYLRRQSYEYYLVDIPNYVRIMYDLVIWTDLQEQMNGLVQSIIGTDGHNWGDYNRFRSVIQGISHDNVNIPGEDRLIKTTISLQVDAGLRNEYDYYESKIQKAFSIKTVKFLSESEEQIIQDDVNLIENVDNDNIADGLDPQVGEYRRKIR